MKKNTSKLGVLISGLILVGCAQPSDSNLTLTPAPTVVEATTNVMDDFNPYDPNIKAQLAEMDRQYEEETGISPFQDQMGMLWERKCLRTQCQVYAVVSLSTQTLQLYIDQQLTETWLVSTGVAGHGTPLLDSNPNGRIYDRYTSTKYPGGDYNGLGNMPYAVFIYEGFAIHGTGTGNWKKLGTKASHGCIRLHPDNALKFNRLVKQYGIGGSWIQVIK